MGKVYRARDSKLDRDVAIKVLPAGLTHLPESAARFEREAKALATLNHPGIASIHGFDIFNGTHFLVMELVEGETLEERLKRGPLPIEGALDIARQIAESLEAAHQRGIVHRDLKPANVKITPEGRVKLLDFGLAKVLSDGASTDPALSDSPTICGSSSTLPGMILGTAAYMSPVQARGNPADEQSDIWSYGVVLYECLTGRSLFTGETMSDILAAVLRAPIPSFDFPPQTPPQVEWLVRKCLARERKHRLQHIGDARVDLEQIIGAPNARLPRVTRPNARFAVAAALLAAVVGLALDRFLKPAPVVRALPSRSADILPGGTRAARAGLAISPDGSTLAYSDGMLSGMLLRSRSLDTGVYKEIAGTENGYSPFFLPDGQSIGFVTRTELRTVSLNGGPPRTIAPILTARGAAWGPDDAIAFAPGQEHGLSIVRAAGGKPEPLTSLAPDERSHRWPQFLPDGKHVLFTAEILSGKGGDDLQVVHLPTKRVKVLSQGFNHALYAHSGHLLQVANDTLYATPFSLEKLSMTGKPAAILPGIRAGDFRAWDVALDGTLVYLPRFTADRSFWWMNPAGELTPASPRKGDFPVFQLSPDQKRVAIWAEGKISVLDLERDTLRRLNRNDSFHRASFLWSPDGGWIVFSTDEQGIQKVWRKRADWSADEELLFEQEGAAWYPWTLSPDGKVLMEDHRLPGRDSGLWTFNIGAGEVPQPYGEPTGCISPRIAPNGQFVSYLSAESGRLELFVRPFRGTSGNQQVSTHGAERAAWSPDGRTLCYTGSRTTVIRLKHVEGQLVARIDCLILRCVVCNQFSQRHLLKNVHAQNLENLGQA